MPVNAEAVPVCVEPPPSPAPGPLSPIQALPGDLGVFAWRGDVTDVDGDGTLDALLAAGGDWYPQAVLGYPAAKDGAFDTTRRWSTTDAGFNSQVRVAEFSQSKGQEILVSTYQGPEAWETSRAEGSGIRSYERYTPGRTSAPRWVLCGVAVNDFVAVDADYDGDLDLFVAATGIDPDGIACGKAAREGAPTPAVVVDRAFLPPFADSGARGTAAVAGPDAEDPLVWPFVGLYLNRGGPGRPSFGTRPDWWVGYPQRGTPDPRTSPPGRPSRIAVMDFDQDGWLDLAVAFMSRSTTVFFGGPTPADLPPSGARLPFPAGTPRVWTAPASPAMANDLAVFALPAGPTAAPDTLRTSLVEARGCVNPETFCATCGIPTKGPLGAGCAPGAADCDACSPTCDAHGELVAHVFPGPETMEILGGRPDPYLAVAPRPVDLPGPGAVPGLMFGYGDDPFGSQLLTAPFVPDGGTEAAPLVSTPAFPIQLVPFDRGAPAPERTVGWAPAPGGTVPGPVITVPGQGVADVMAVTSDGKAIAECSGKATPCWRWSPVARAVVVYPATTRLVRPTVTYRPLTRYQVLMVVPNPLTMSAVLDTTPPK